MQKPTVTLSLGQRSQEAEQAPSLLFFPLHLGRMNSHRTTHSPPQPGGWVLASETGRWVYLKSHPGGQCCYSHCLCEIFAQQQQASSEPLCEGEEQQAGSQALQKLQGHEPEFSSQCWIEDPPWGPWSQTRGWMRVCEQASLDDIPVTQMALNSYAQFQANAESRVSWVC